MKSNQLDKQDFIFQQFLSDFIVQLVSQSSLNSLNLQKS